jgi:hypothetical protein
MSVCTSTCGANVGNKVARLLMRIVSATELKTAPPKYWQNMTSDVPIAASCAGRELWIARKGYMRNLLTT